jgi:hypothetical protein
MKRALEPGSQESHDINVFFWGTQCSSSGWWLTILKNMQVSWDDYSQYMENKKYSKPPNRQCSSSNNTSKHIMTHHDTPYASGHIMTDQETS